MRGGRETTRDRSRLSLSFERKWARLMIRMSRARGLGSLLVAGLVIALGGCCGSGGGSSHKCDFTPAPTDQDGGPDAPMACGTAVCQPPQVCCLKKSPLLALCVDFQNFEEDGCEKPDAFDCLVPADCPGGFTCCFKFDPNKPPIAPKCLPPMYCPDDGTSLHTCSGPQDCPAEAPECTFLGSGEGVELRVCYP
jgi:hypothetical protein